MNKEKHSIEAVFVLVLFAVFLLTVTMVLTFGANSYRSLAERDNKRYDKRLITSYVATKVRSHDVAGAVSVGGFTDVREEDGIETLHLYRTIDGEDVDTRIYYYKGYIYELFTLSDLKLKPEAGNPIIEAKSLSFEKKGAILWISSEDVNGVESSITVALRSESGVVP